MNNIVVPKCDHNFEGGLCTFCLCPETEADNERAANAFQNKEQLMTGARTLNIGNPVSLDRNDAIFVAWKLNSRKER